MQDQDYPVYIDGHSDGQTDPMVDLESAKRCLDCGGRVEWYWTHDEVWLRGTAPGEESEWICLRCLSERLHRPVTTDDLIDSPVNRKALLLERLSIPYGYCYCNCGGETQIAAKTNRAQAQVRGKPNRYVAGHKAKKHPDHLPEDRGYETPCWIWQGGHDRNGYGWVNRPEHAGVPHVMYYKRVHGPIPKGLELDHLCKVRDCVNPDHLEAVTRAENMARSNAPSMVNKRKTHCKHGHEFTPENIYRPPTQPGTRLCRICHARRNAERVERERAQRAAQEERRAAADLTLSQLVRHPTGL